jgi:molybdate transport system substrate-binding protein
MRTILSRTAVLIAAAAFIAGSAGPPAPARAESGEIVALVASNAEGAFTELIRQFQVKHKGVVVKAQYLGGATIATMIDQQKDADVILIGDSALAKELNYVDPPTPILKNKEIILLQKGNPAKIKSLKDLANPGVKLSMGTATSAVGKLASQVIQNAAGDYGMDFIQGLAKNVVSKEEKGSDVVGAVGKTANSAIAFASDFDPAKFGAVQIDDKYNVVSTYVMTVPKNSKNAALGKDFVAMVAGPQGQATLKKFRYMSPK